MQVRDLMRLMADFRHKLGAGRVCIEEEPDTLDPILCWDFGSFRWREKITSVGLLTAESLARRAMNAAPNLLAK